ncbi:MAG: type 4a pilus biogenesis protein PilO [Gammaproteobacteria bacterium]|nr:type 4a pilus biogenesis protein PilO [Gammaproteobacteria bacterium]
MKLSEVDLNDLDLDNIGSWPLAAKSITLVVMALVLLGVGYALDTSSQVNRLESTQKKEGELKQLFEIKQAKAANLDSYKLQLEEIQKTFGSLLNQLPGKTEVADLLTDVTQTGLTNGLEFDFFKPQDEIPKDFYVELPIELKVRGEYHEFGKFMSGVAGLPRIVTIHDFTITKSKEKDNKSRPPKHELVLEANAKTYRYLDEKELKQLSGKQ